MFQADTAGMSHYNKEYNIKSVISTGLWDVLDVPKKKRDWKTKPEKPYFCAAMDKTESTLIEKSSLSLDHAKLIWDIVEVSTRMARKKLAELVHKMDSVGVYAQVSSKGIKLFKNDPDKPTAQKKTGGLIWLYFRSALEYGEEFHKKAVSGFLREVVIKEDHFMYQKYREMIDEYLESFKEYATTEEEIQRFITKTPPSGYMASPYDVPSYIAEELTKKY